MAERDAYNDYVNGIGPKNGKKGKKPGTSFAFLWLVSIVLFILFTFFIACGWIWTIIFGISVGVFSVLTIYFYLAPRNLFVTTRRERTAKAITAGEALVRIISQQDKPPVFGLYFFPWPFQQVYEYDFSWVSIDQYGEEKEHKERLDYILLSDAVYFFKVTEEVDKNLLPLDVKGLITVRVVEPHLALFAAQNWLKIVIALIQTLIRGEIAEGEYKELTAGRKMIGTNLMNDPDVKRVLAGLETDYGIRVLKIEIRNIDPPAKFRELTMAEIIAEQEKKAILIRAGAEAERIEKVCSAIDKQGSIGRINRAMEMLEKTNNQVVISSNIIEAVEGLLGGKGRNP